MGCGCKRGEITPDMINKKTGGLNLKGKLIRLPLALLMTLLIMVLSPFLLLMIWFIAVKSVFGKHQNVVDLMLSNFIKKPKEISNVEEDEDDFNEEDYEIVGVDIIK